MYKKLHLKIMILLCALVAGGSAWAETATLPNTQALTTSFANVGEDSNIQIKTSSANTYTNPLRFYANVTITIKAAEGYTIQSVTYEASSTGNYVTYAQNAAVNPTVTPTVSGKNVTWSFTNGTSEFTFKPSTQTRANSITIEYSASGDIPTVPVINANDVDLEYNATSGEITYNVANPVDDVSLSATTTADWISDIVVDATNNKVTFNTTVNEGAADRTGTITLTYTGATDKPVTVTQGHLVLDYAVLPFSYDGNGANAEDENGVTTYGLDSYNNSPAIKFDGSGDYLILKTNAAPATISFVVKGNGSGSDPQTGTFKVQTSADGENYSDLAVYETFSSDATEISLYNLDENVRYVKWIYYEKVIGNVALGSINVTAELPTFTAEVTSAKWASYVPPINVSFPTGVQAYIVNDVNSTKVSLTEVLAVPAGTPVVLNAEQGTYTLSVEAAADCDDVSANQLVVSDGTVEGDGATIYALGNKGGSIGFKRVKSGVTVPAGKPYLTIANGAKDFFGFDEGEATGIESIENAGFSFSAPVYDLQGRLVNKLQKGIFIQNGKKVVVK